MMPTVRPATEADRERWDAYVLSRPESHFGQRWTWRMLTLRTYPVGDCCRLAEEDGRVRGVLPLFHDRRGRRLFSAPGGLLADGPGVAEALLAPAREHVRRAGLAYLELRDQRTAWPGLETSAEHVTLMLDLAPDAPSQWTAFDAKLRNQVRKAQKSGFTACWGREHLGDFHRVLLENMRDLGTPVRWLPYYRRVLDVLGEAADVLVVRRAGEAAGAMFTIAHGDTLADPWASSRRRHLAYCPNHMLYWEALQRAIALGMKRFDFGRSQWHSNTYRFKEQWGARPVQLYYQYALGHGTAVPTLASQKSSFDLAVRLWRKLPLPVAGLLGEPVKRMFPEVL
ncbi:MAG: GNAT family N-acetyltransferase [Candidatus Eisenbacteria bacterium]|nr:GNAT family N-acetyltransferase [Candidatus Eisenbacteria bacterium]